MKKTYLRITSFVLLFAILLSVVGCGTKTAGKADGKLVSDIVKAELGKL